MSRRFDGSDNSGEETGSPTQQAWVELAGTIRAELLRVVKQRMHDLSAPDIKTLIEATREGLWLEERCRTFDSEIAREQARAYYEKQ